MAGMPVPSRRTSQQRLKNLGGVSDAIWAESRRRQGEAKTHARFAPGELREHLVDLPQAVVRPSAGVAYVSEERPSVNSTQGASGNALATLEERILRAFDPNGTLGG